MVLAPEEVLVLPKQLRQVIDPLTRALGRHRLPEAIATEIWQRAEDVVHEILGRPGPLKQVRRLADALDSDRVGELEGGSYLILSDPSDVDAAMIDDAIQGPLAGYHAGWRPVIAAATAVNFSEAGTSTRDAVVALAQSLSAPVPAEHQVAMLASIAVVTPPQRLSRSASIPSPAAILRTRGHFFRGGITVHHAAYTGWTVAHRSADRPVAVRRGAESPTRGGSWRRV